MFWRTLVDAQSALSIANNSGGKLMTILKTLAVATALTIGAASLAVAQNGPATGGNTPAAGGAGNSSTGMTGKGAGAGDSGAMNKGMGSGTMNKSMDKKKNNNN
jgi:hypothetical protein